MIVGTAGHIDHGKTSLVRALTGVDTDRLKEEKTRGISIDLGFAYLPVPDGASLGFVDVPGHEKFIRNMLAGATGIDFVLLVVAADDGPMPQTIEHLAIADLLAIERGLIALTKIDLTDAAGRAKACADVARIVRGTCLDGAEIVPVSTATGEGIDVLRARLFDAARTSRRRATEGRFRLAVDRSFTLAGTGTVVTGTVLSGTVSLGDRLTVSPFGLAARVRSIHAHDRPAECGTAGQRCALNLTGEGISKDAVARGAVVLDPALHAPTDRIDARLRLLATELRPVAQWMPVRLHHATAEVGAHVVLLEDQVLGPGSEALVQLILDRPIAAAAADRFVLRDTSAQRTIGGGRFLDLRAPMRKRRSPERLAQLNALSCSEARSGLAAFLNLPPHFTNLSAFARDWALSDVQIEAIAEQTNIIRVPAAGTTFGMSAPASERFTLGVLNALQVFHADNPDLPGIGLERMRLQLVPAMPKPVFIACLQPLLREKKIAMDGAWIRLAGHEVHLTAEDENIWRRIAPLLAGVHRFRPPRVRDLANALDLPEADLRRLLKLLGRMGKVDQVAHDHFFLRAVAEMIEIMLDLAGRAANGQFTAAQFRDRLDNGRKVAIQSLEFFDRHGVTLRRGDLRRVNPHRLDLFRAAVEPTGRAA